MWAHLAVASRLQPFECTLELFNRPTTWFIHFGHIVDGLMVALQCIVVGCVQFSVLIGQVVHGKPNLVRWAIWNRSQVHQSVSYSQDKSHVYWLTRTIASTPYISGAHINGAHATWFKVSARFGLMLCGVMFFRCYGVGSHWTVNVERIFCPAHRAIFGDRMAQNTV